VRRQAMPPAAGVEITEEGIVEAGCRPDGSRCSSQVPIARRSRRQVRTSVCHRGGRGLRTVNQKVSGYRELPASGVAR
jgi:hypothetical protein